MTQSVLGFVFHVTRHLDGNIEIDFFDFEKEEKLTYSTKDGLPREIASALADSLGRNIWTKIDHKDGKLASVSFEEYNFEKDSFKLRKKLEKVWKGYLERV